MSDHSAHRPWLNRIHATIAGARFFTVSLLIHLIILLAASSVVIFKAYIEAPDFEAGGGELVGNDKEPTAPPEKVEVQQEQFQPDVKVPTSNTLDVISTNAATDTFRVSNTSVSRLGTTVDGMAEKIADLGRGMGGGSGRGGMAGGTMMTFMGTKATASSAIFVVDVSGSMVMGEKSVKTYEHLEKEIVKVVKGFGDTMKFGIIVFSRDAKSYNESLVRATSIEKERALNWLRKLSPAVYRDPRADENEKAFHQGTRADRGLEEAFAMKPDVIFFVSDGEPTGSKPPQILEQVKAAQKNMPKPIVVNVVAYCADSGHKFMQDLATQNQGTFREVNPKEVK